MNISCNRINVSGADEVAFECPLVVQPQSASLAAAAAHAAGRAGKVRRLSLVPGKPAERRGTASFSIRFARLKLRFLQHGAAVVLLLAAVVSLDAAGLKPGDTFPALAQFNLEGSLPDIKGKVVLVDFFASWCGPCKDSFPAMQELHRKFADKGLVIVAVNLDRKKADMEDFLKKHPVDFAILRDAANKLVTEIKIPTMPTSFLLDRNGRVLSVHRGFKEAETRRQYVEELEALLK